MSEPDGGSELRASYRTLNEPTRLLGLSLGAWAALVVAFAAGYGVLSASPLPWRLNFSAAAIGLGAPVILLVLREPGTIGPGRLLAAVFAWRLRPTRVVAVDEQRRASKGAVRLESPPEAREASAGVDELPWTGEASS